jgi:hypothetical protein
MLVRNNTVCPHCGKLSATDFYVLVDWNELDLDFWTVKVECFDCLSIEDYKVHKSVLRGWMRLLAPAGDPVERWSSCWSDKLSAQQRDSLISSFERIIPRGGVDSRSPSFPRLWKIIQYLRRERGPIDGSTFAEFSRAWSCL